MKLRATLMFCFVVVACQHVERPEPPADLIAKDKMADIMTEVYLGNAAKSVNNRVIRQYGLELDSLIYCKYDIDSMQFVRSNAYYTSRLDDYTEIFEQVEARLTELKQLKDSINIQQTRSASDSLSEGELIEPAGAN